MPHTYYTSGAILHSTQEVEVALTILKLTGTGGQAGRRAGRQAQVSIGMHAHPKMICISKSHEGNLSFCDMINLLSIFGGRKLKVKS